MSHLNAIIVFNTDSFIKKQAELIKKHVGGDILIVDNGNNYEVSRSLKTIADGNGYQYLKTSINEADFSKSHAYAATVALEMYRHDYDSIFLLDHDIFPFKQIKLPTKYYLAGVPQIRKTQQDAPHKVELTYLWPGCLFVNTKDLDGVEIDLTPQIVQDIFLDTGGGLYKLVQGNKDYVKLLDERHENDYSIIDESWMHFRKGSNWSKDEGHAERMERLFKVLESKL